MISRLSRGQFLAGAVIAALGLAYLPLFEYKTAWLGQGDIQVFFRAGWAIWSGFPLYQVTDYHGWSYHYPPTFALLMGPFADPLPGHPRLWWAMPYPVATAVWYLLSVAFAIAATQTWATALERTRPLTNQTEFSRFALRFGSFAGVIPYIGDGLARGQPTALLLLLCVGFLVLYTEKRLAFAAFALALAIVIKLFPVVLVLLPLLRRDLKCLVWIAIWCVVLLLVLPAICIGASATVDLYKAMWADHLAAILSGSSDAKFIRETDPGGHDVVSIGGALARIAAGRWFTGQPLPAWASISQYVFDAGLIAAVAVLGRGGSWDWRSPQPASAYPLLVAGAVLVAAMPIMITLAKPNYVTLEVPLLGVLIIETWRRRGEIIVTPGMIAWAAFAWFAMIQLELHWVVLILAAPMTLAILWLLIKGLALMAELSAEPHTPWRPAAEVSPEEQPATSH